MLAVTILYVSCTLNVHDSENVIYSPDQKKSVSFYHLNEDRTQVMVNFERRFPKGGAGIFSIGANRDEVKIHWTNNHTLSIQYPAGRHISQKEELVGFFRDSVRIIYSEYNPD